MSRTALICWASAGGRASIRSRGFTCEAELPEDLQPEPVASTVRLIASEIKGRHFISLILSLHPAFPLQHRFQSLLRFLRQMVRLAVRRILARNDVGAERLHCIGNQSRCIAVTADEFSCGSERKIQ